MTDLQWEDKVNSGGGKTKTVKRATIPWDRLDDFIEGEMTTRQFRCTFLEDVHHGTKKGRVHNDRLQIRAESAIQDIKSVIMSCI